MSGVDKLAGIKPGDRVRVTFEGDMSETSGVHLWPVVTDGMSAPTMWVMPDLHCPPQIERIEPPLKVGDRVRIAGLGAMEPGSQPGEILAIHGPHAWMGGNHVVPLSVLERIQ